MLVILIICPPNFLKCTFFLPVPAPHYQNNATTYAVCDIYDACRVSDTNQDTQTDLGALQKQLKTCRHAHAHMLFLLVCFLFPCERQWGHIVWKTKRSITSCLRKMFSMLSCCQKWTILGTQWKLLLHITNGWLWLAVLGPRMREGNWKKKTAPWAPKLRTTLHYHRFMHCQAYGAYSTLHVRLERRTCDDHVFTALLSLRGHFGLVINYKKKRGHYSKITSQLWGWVKAYWGEV